MAHRKAENLGVVGALRKRCPRPVIFSASVGIVHSSVPKLRKWSRIMRCMEFCGGGRDNG